MNNREYLFSLSNKELAEYLFDDCNSCIYNIKNSKGFDFCNSTFETPEESCEHGHVLWLQLEYKPNINICPHCGNKQPKIMGCYNTNFEDTKYYVECEECEMRGPKFLNEKLAAAAWNALGNKEEE